MHRILPSLSTHNEYPFLSLFARGESRIVRRAKIAGRKTGRVLRKKGVPAARRLGSGVSKTGISTLKWARDNPRKALLLGYLGVQGAKQLRGQMNYRTAKKTYERTQPGGRQTVDVSSRRL